MRHTFFTSSRFRGLIGMFCLFILVNAMSTHHRSPGQAHGQSGMSQSLHGAPAINYLKEQGLYNRLQDSIATSRYELSHAPLANLSQARKSGSEVYSADNPAQQLKARFSREQFTIEPTQEAGTRSWQASLKLRSYGYGTRMVAAKAEGMRAEGSRVEIKHSALVEWYVNTREGIEQGFTLAARPGLTFGTERLRVALAVTGELNASLTDEGQAVVLSQRDGTQVLRYDHLTAIDAVGRSLPAHLAVASDEVSLVVDDATAIYPITIDPLFTQVKKLTANDGMSRDGFYTVGISGDTVVVGAYGNNSAIGAAYIFDRNQGGAENWGLVKKITPNGTLGDFGYFGAGVGISGDTIVVGAYQDNDHRGAAYIFERNQGGTNNWGQVKKFTASDVADPDFFASAVAISGDTVVIGAYHKQFFTGAAYIFARNQGGAENWGQVKKLTASDITFNDQFGGSVAINGDTIVVGALGKNSNTGAAYIFGRNQGGTNAWGQVKKLSISDGVAQDVFGASVGIGGNTVVVGAFGKNSTTGAAYIFERNQGGANNWGQVRMLTAGNGASPDRFGVSVSITSDLVAVGADQYSDNNGETFKGAVYLFGRNQGGTDNWGQTQKLTANDEADYDYFGADVGISGDTTNGYRVIVGALFANNQAGAAYIFSNGCRSPLLTPAALPSAQVGVPYNQTVTASTPGASYNFAVTSGALPNGLTLNSSTGLISGTPSQQGFFNFRILAGSTDGCPGYGDYAVSVACTPVSLSPATLPNSTVGTAYNQTIAASPALTYNYSVTSGALPTGLTLNAATGIIGGTPTVAGTYAFRISAMSGGCSGYFDYSVTINCSPATLSSSLPNPVTGAYYNQTIAVTPNSSYTFSLIAGALPSGLMLNAQTGAISGLPFAPGTYNFTIRAQTASGCTGQQTYTLAINCPTITLSALTTPMLNTPYNQTVTTTPTGGGYTYAVTAGALPNGLTLISSTGVVSGTPTVAGTFNFTITATGFGTCTGYRAYSFTISSGACPTITLPALPNGNVGQMYNNLVAATPSGSYSYTLSGALPPGVTFYNASGLLFGYPAAAGTYNFTITATDASNCTGSRSYSVTITP